MTLPLPNLTAPLADVKIIINGKEIKGKAYLRDPWNSYLQQFTQAPPAVVSAVLTVSPFVVIANANGSMAITGGTVTNITLTRGNVVLNLGAGTDRIIPIKIADTISIAYSFIPSINFLPD